MSTFYNSIHIFGNTEKPHSMIQEDVLLTYGATFRKYKKDQCVFFEGDEPLFFFQISKGSVRMVNIFRDGKEFIQGLFNEGQSFGEPSLLINARYPATAIANEDTVILKIAKENFLYLLRNNEEILYDFATMLGAMLYMKTAMAKEIARERPHHRIVTLLHMLKKQSGCPKEKVFKIELSRQRIADMLGLRVETVIRTMKRLEEDGFIAIKKGKAYI
jgi:CRP-like cAMP-binding protein